MVHFPAFELDFFNRVLEPMGFAVVVYFLCKICELIDHSLVPGDWSKL